MGYLLVQSCFVPLAKHTFFQMYIYIHVDNEDESMITGSMHNAFRTLLECLDIAITTGFLSAKESRKRPPIGLAIYVSRVGIYMYRYS